MDLTDALTPEDAAAAAAISLSTLRRRIRCGEVQTHRWRGRVWITRGDVEALVAREQARRDGEPDDSPT